MGNEVPIDLITHYFNNEKDHIPLLYIVLRNREEDNEKTFFSNLFNFKVNFSENEVIIEDQCGLFKASNPKGFQIMSIENLLVLCEKKMSKK